MYSIFAQLPKKIITPENDWNRGKYRPYSKIKTEKEQVCFEKICIFNARTLQDKTRMLELELGLKTIKLNIIGK